MFDKFKSKRHKTSAEFGTHKLDGRLDIVKHDLRTRHRVGSLLTGAMSYDRDLLTGQFWTLTGQNAPLVTRMATKNTQDLIDKDAELSQNRIGTIDVFNLEEANLVFALTKPSERVYADADMMQIFIVDSLNAALKKQGIPQFPL